MIEVKGSDHTGWRWYCGGRESRFLYETASAALNCAWGVIGFDVPALVFV